MHTATSSTVDENNVAAPIVFADLNLQDAGNFTLINDGSDGINAFQNKFAQLLPGGPTIVYASNIHANSNILPDSTQLTTNIITDSTVSNPHNIQLEIESMVPEEKMNVLPSQTNNKQKNVKRKNPSIKVKKEPKKCKSTSKTKSKGIANLHHTSNISSDSKTTQQVSESISNKTFL